MPMPFNGKRLEEARRFRKLSISDLANQIEISKQMVSKYERGEAVPSAKNYQKLVFFLKFPLSFFQQEDRFEQENLGTFYRSRFTSTQTKKKPSELKKKYLAILANLFEQYVDFPALSDNSDFSNDPALAAKQLRDLWRLGNGPISDVMNLLEHHGFKVATISSNSDKVDTFSSEIKINQEIYYCILIDENNNSYFRQRFNLAHELGHWVLHSGKVCPQELDSIDYRNMENEANEFASNFLLPAPEFASDILGMEKDLNNYLRLKQKWKISISAMIYHANNLGLLEPNEFRSLQKKLSYNHWCYEEPLDRDYSVRKPALMRQAFNLINEVELFDGNAINELLGNKYGILLPLKTIAELLGISISELQSNNSNIVKYKNTKGRN